MNTIVTARPAHITPSTPHAIREIVTSIDTTVVVGEQQLREAEHQRGVEAELEVPDDVLVTGAIEHEH